MPQISITQLPQAQALTGTESVPIVQGGVTVQTTTGAISGAGALNYPFLTVGSTAGLTQARQIAAGAGLSLADSGAGSTLQINMTGAALSLNSSNTGLQVKTGISTVVARQIAVGGGMTISDADGVAGNPTIGLNTNLQNLSALSGTGLMTISGSTFSQTSIVGTANEISVVDGNALGGNPTIGLVSDPILPGTGSVVLPQGTTAERTASNFGAIRYNTETQSLEAYTQSIGWGAIVSGAGVTTFSAGSTGFTPNTPTSGGITLGGILSPQNGGTGVDNNSYTITLNGNVLLGGALTTADSFTTSGSFGITLTSIGATNVTLPTTGTLATLAGVETLTNKTISGLNNTLSDISNSSLSNSSVTFNGVTVALGASGTITAATTNALTVGTGLQLNSGTTFDGSAAKTISIDSNVVTLGDVQTLTNKSMSGASNTFTNIPNSALSNSSLTIGTTSISLGGTSLTLGGLTSVTLTQDPVSALQAATKQYVDAVAEGLHIHASCAAATTGTLASITGGTVTYNNGSAGVGATLTLSVALTTLDGYSLQNNDRVIVKNEANQAYNGIYTWATGGTVLTRATDFDTTTEVASGDFTFVTNGTLYANTGWVQTNNTTAIGTSPIAFVQFSGAGTYTAGTGLTLTGTQFSITNTTVSAASYGSASQVATFTVNAQGQLTAASNTSIAINGNQITSGTVGSSYISGSYTGITGVGTLTSGTWNATTIDVAYGGTGLTSYASGDMLYATAATTLSKLSIGASTYVMTSSGTAPQWSAPSGLTVGTATNAINTGITADSTNATRYLTFVSATTGNLPQLVNSSISCNPSTGQITGGIAGGSF